MNDTFELILQQLLEDYEKDTSRDIDQYLAEKLKEMGMEDECVSDVIETSEIIDDFDAKRATLEEALENGQSRQKWMIQQLDKSLDGFEEETKLAVINALDNTIEKQQQNIVNQITE